MGLHFNLWFNIIYIIKLFAQIHVYMSAIAGQTGGPNGLKFFEGTYGYPKGKITQNSKI